MMDERAVEALLDRMEISRVVHRYATGVDTHDWALLRDCFTDTVVYDFSSWDGHGPRELPANVWVRGVTAGLSGFDTTQHLSANHVTRLSSDGAHCRSYVLARHWLDSRCYALGGFYDNHLVRPFASGPAAESAAWKIQRCKLSVTWHTGPRDIFAEAARRFAKNGEAA